MSTSTIIPSCEADLLVDAHAQIGESPIWAAEEAALYWIDVKAPALYRTKLATAETISWPLPSDIGGYALTPDGDGAIVGLRSGLFSLNFTSKELRKLFDPPFDPRTHRFNEGDCDASGRLWLGTMFDPLPDVDAAATPADLYSFTFADGLVRHDEPSLLHNGFAWSRDNQHFFLAHSREGRIYKADIDIAAGRLGARRVFAEVPDDVGVPDGAAFDELGYYWSAIHGGGRLHRYAPDGRLDRVISLPIQNPTMMAFCGPELSDLCITSANHGEDGRPHEGGIFIMKPGVGGLPRRRFIA